MIKFFRRIRKSLLSENPPERTRSVRASKFSKYLLYALGEIILVVIGILIALQINNWNEDRKATEREHELLLQLNEELIDTKRELDVDLHNAYIYYRMTDSLIFYDEKTSLYPLSHYFIPQGEDRFYNNAKLFGNKSTYTTLKSIGLEIFFIKQSNCANNIIIRVF